METGREELLEAVREVIRDHLGRSQPVDLASDLVSDLALDSLDRLTLVVELETRFDVCLVEADAEQDIDVVRVAELVARLEACLAHKQAGYG